MSIKIKYCRTKNGMIAIEDVRALGTGDIPYEYWQQDTCCYMECGRLVIKYKNTFRRMVVGDLYTPAEFEAMLAMIREAGEILHNLGIKPKFRASSYYVKI